MYEGKNKEKYVKVRGLFIILFTLMIASTVRACSIGDFVWYDVDGDGIQDPDEGGVAGVTVTAYACDTTEQIGTAVTYASGRYSIHWPSIPQPFYLKFVLPPDVASTYTFTAQDQGGDEEDSDVDASGWTTECFEWPDRSIKQILDFDAGIVEKAGPCGECQGGVTILSLRYLGQLKDDDVLTIEVYEGKSAKASKLIYTTVINNEEREFTVTGTRSDFQMGSEISIWVDGVLNAKIHTSCSQPIGPGLIRGDFEVVEGYSKDGGKLCPVPDCGKCEGKVTRLKLKYEGALTEDIMVIQKKGITVVEDVEPGDEFVIAGLDKNGTLGSEISLHVGDDPVATKIHTSCSQPIGPGMRFGPFLIVEGFSQKGGRLCPAVSSQGCGCEGKVTQLTLQYNGGSRQFIAILQKKENDPVFADYIEPGTPFTFTGHDKKGTLGTEIAIYTEVNDNLELHTKIHTSCSQPIGPGMVFGDFEIIEGDSLKGGPLCPLGKND